MTPANVLSARQKTQGYVEELAARTVQFVWLDDVQSELAMPWLVSGFLPQTGLALFFGESGCGKTFLVLDVGLCVAAGRPWGGKPVNQGVVIYIAAENPESVKRRAELWRRERGEVGIPFAIYPAAVDFLNLSAVSQLISDLEPVATEYGGIRMVVIDTVARSMPGADENSSRDMGALIASCDALRRALNTLVCLIHHAGKDTTKGARGSSSLRAAVDTEIEVTGSDGRHASIVTKQRDGETGARFEFRLAQFVLGQSEQGEDVTTCLVESVAEAAAEKTKKPERLTAPEKMALSALHELLDDPSCRVADSAAIAAGARIGQTAVTYAAWRLACYARHISDSENPEARKKAFQRAVTGLQAKSKVKVLEDQAWLA